MLVWLLGLPLIAFGLLEDDDVVVLKKNTFDAFISPEKNFITMLEFYAPWCGHCKQFAPVYSEVAKALKELNPESPIRVAKIDATEPEMSSIAERYGVTGYPTLKLVRNGEVTDWKGGREKQEIIDELVKMSDPEWAPPPSDVIVLNNDNFDEIVPNEDFIIVEFYAPWCGHCKKLEPEWELAATDLAPDGIKLAKVDATEAAELAQKYDVTGYPTIKMFRKGSVFDYNGGRERHSIVSYLTEQAGPPSTEITTKKAFDNILKKGSPKGAGTPVIAFFANGDDELIVPYADGANQMREDYQFYHVYGDNVAKFGGKVGELRLYQKPHLQSKFEKPFLGMNIDADTDGAAVKEFVISATLPLVGHLNSQTAKFYMDNTPFCVAFYHVDFGFDYIKATQLVRSKILNVAKNHRDVVFAVADEDEQAELVKKFNLQDSGEDVNVGCRDKNGLNYPMPEDEVDEDTLGEFLSDFKKGKAKPFIKSKPVPKKQGNVIEVVGKTFNDIVMDESKDVLIEFYAPWCGHCKSLIPVYNELGDHFSSNKNVVIAKMDATNNDIGRPDLFDVSGFPTIYFRPAGGDVMKYESGRDLESFKTFISENGAAAGSSKDEL